MTPDERYSKFEDWLTFMPVGLKEWMAELPKDLVTKLDYSIGSLDSLEAWLIATYPDTKTAFSEVNLKRMDGAARYVGETLRRNFDAKWDIHVHDPDSIAYGMPHLTGFPTAGPPLVPLMVVRNAIKRRTGEYLAFIAKHQG